MEFKVASATETTKPEPQSSQSNEPKEMSFDQLVDDLIIKAANDNTIAKIELTSTALTEVKGEKSRGGNKIFELPFKLTIDKEYTKNMRKLFMALKDDAGEKISLDSVDVATGESKNLNKANVDGEKLALLKSKLDSAIKFGLRILLEDQDGIELQSLEYSSTSGFDDDKYKIEYNNPGRSIHDMYRLISSQGFTPKIDSSITFYTGEVEGKFLISLSKDILDEINNGGKIKLTYTRN